MGTLAFSDAGDTPLRSPLRRLKRRASPSPLGPTDTGLRALGGYRSPSPPSPSPERARQRTAFDVLRAGKPKPKLGRSEFIEGEAVESDEEDTLGFGGARRKPGADDEGEEDEEERDKLVEALMDDTAMSEDALKRDLVLEKFQ